MADLDDFFAKKDRKKSKSKKFATTEEVAKKLEDTKKIEKNVKKERPQEGEEGGAPVQDQDEWKDFEEEKKDYSGLKIGNLTINPNNEVNSDGTDSGNEQQQRFDEAGNEVERKVGPWKKMENIIVSEILPPQEKEPEKKLEAPPPTGKAYVPPSLRSSQQPTVPQTRSKNKAAPDIHNEQYFPTLSGSKSDRRTRNEGTFEVVSHSKSNSLKHTEQARLSASQGPKLTLGNRYDTLSNS